MIDEIVHPARTQAQRILPISTAFTDFLHHSTVSSIFSHPCHAPSFLPSDRFFLGKAWTTRYGKVILLPQRMTALFLSLFTKVNPPMS